jgi:chromosome segregation ATPase
MDCCCQHKTEIAVYANASVHSSNRIAQLESELEALKRELKETQDRCVDWATSKGTILAMYDNLRLEHEALRRERAMLVDTVKRNVAEFERDEVRAEDALKNLNCALSATEPQATQWLEEKKAEAFEQFISQRRNWDLVSGGYWLVKLQEHASELRLAASKRKEQK